MNRYDYYSGEPRSPEFASESTNMSVITENVGQQQTQYNYDPNLRYNQIQQQSQSVYQFGGYGYNQQAPYQSGPFMNPPINPYQQQNRIVGNPAFAYMNQMNYGQPLNLSYEDKVVHVPGLNPGSEVLLPENAEEICNKLQMEMLLEQEEAIAKRNERFQGYFNNNYGGYNYYGMPYMNSWTDQTVNMKYRKIVDNMRQEAINRRKSFNKNLSRLAHNYLGDDISDDDIDNIYEGYNYTIPATSIRSQANQTRFANMVPVETQNHYIEHHNAMNKMYNNIVDPNANMQQFLQQQGTLQSYYNLEDEMHRRRDASQYYQADGYKHFLRKAVRERNGVQTNMSQNNNQPLNGFPVLGNSAQILEDGSLSISAPSWMGGSVSHIQFNNELEKHFEENRSKFLQSIYEREGMNNGT